MTCLYFIQTQRQYFHVEKHSLLQGVAALLVVLFHAPGHLAKVKYFGAVTGPVEKNILIRGERWYCLFLCP